MDNKIVDFYYYDDFDEDEFAEAFSDLQKFGVNQDEQDLDYKSDLFD
jgi:hypothetical protein